MKRTAKICTFLFLFALVGILCVSCTESATRPKDNTIRQGNARFQVLTPTLIRLEYSSEGEFENRPSFNAINRSLSNTDYTTSRKNGYRIIRTDHLTLRYRVGSGPFTTENVSVTFTDGDRKLTAHPYWSFAPLCIFRTRCEAEASKLNGATGRGGIWRSILHEGYTGIGFVAHFQHSYDGATQTIWGVPEEGRYKLTIRYANGAQSTRSLSVRINGEDVGLIELPPSGGWEQWDFAYIDVELEKGSNVLYLSRGEGTGDVNIDNFAVTRLDVMDYSEPSYHVQNQLGGWRRALDEAREPRPFLPGMLNRDGWYLLDDTQTAVFDNGKVVSRPDHAGEAYQDGYLFVYGQDYKQALRDFRDLTGPPPLLPRASFGVWFSRYDTYTADKLREIVHEFKEHRIPLEVLLVDTDFKAPSKWFGWNWDRDLFPKPKKFIDWVQGQGLKLLANIHPGITRDDPKFDKAQEIAGRTLIPRSPDSLVYNFDFNNPKHVRAYFWLHEQLRLGDDELQWWYDSSGPQSSSSSKYGVAPDTWINYLYAKHAKSRGLRPMVLARGFSSIQHRGHSPFFAAGPWAEHRYSIHSTHDVTGQWDMLRFESTFTAALGSVGHPYEAHVAGGFLGDSGEDELYARWVQFATFQPILWLHSVYRAPRNKLPWNYGKKAERSASKFLRLREALVPYSYTLARIAHDSGIPMVRAMYIEYPKYEEAYRHSTQYMYGDDVLVAPITEPAGADNVAETKVWFPPGTWIDYFTGTQYQGSSVHTVDTPLSRMPVYVQAGSVIPMQPYQGVGQSAPDTPILLKVYAGDNGSTRIYQDAGDGLGYLQGQYSWTKVTHTQSGNGRQIVHIGAAERDFPGQPDTRRFRIQLVNVSEPTQVHVGNQWLPQVDKGSTERGWWYDVTARTVHVKLAPATYQSVQVSFAIDSHSPQR